MDKENSKLMGINCQIKTDRYQVLASKDNPNKGHPF